MVLLRAGLSDKVGDDGLKVMFSTRLTKRLPSDGSSQRKGAPLAVRARVVEIFEQPATGIPQLEDAACECEFRGPAACASSTDDRIKVPGGRVPGLLERIQDDSCDRVGLGAGDVAFGIVDFDFADEVSIVAGEGF